MSPRAWRSLAIFWLIVCVLGAAYYGLAGAGLNIHW